MRRPSLELTSVQRSLVAAFFASVCAASTYGDASDPPSLKIVTLGDSITKGVRTGVRAEETFAALVETGLRQRGVAVEVVNAGIGGERTDQALARLENVIELAPSYVTVMYGTNDSYVDRGGEASRLSVSVYRDNLREIVRRLLLAGAEPVLMTSPRWAPGARNGIGEDPNDRLVEYVEACRQVARELDVALVDHFAAWTSAEAQGEKLIDWTTDRCHPNRLGHVQLAESILAVLNERLTQAAEAVPFRVNLETILEHDDGKFLWFHPRVTAMPRREDELSPTVLMTIQKHLRTSDHYSGLSDLYTLDLGATWSAPRARPELDWTPGGEGVDVAVADVTPGWHATSGCVIAIGAQVRYSRDGRQLEDQPRAHQTAYAIFDPRHDRWTRWRRLDMPTAAEFNFARSACAQFVVEPDGTLLLPFYIATSAAVPYSTTVVQCAFDGEEITYREHGDVLELSDGRGLYEPSLVRFQKRYYLTIRGDSGAYVTAGEDGLHYRPVKAWRFDDGTELGSYNTQQHWLTTANGLFLVYTRRGAENDHIMRHRAPLFMAQVDPDRLHVLRGTEKVLVPERGATLGNFGAAPINRHESWVTVAEGVWNDDARRRGATGAVFLARVEWSSAVAHTFDAGHEGWKVYDYEAAAARRDGFPAVTWEHSDGVADSGHVSADDARWTIDTPERPHSILPFIIYRQWTKRGGLDLRGATLSVYLRGDDLDLKGGTCLFWVLNHKSGTRWHYAANPLTIFRGGWGPKQQLELANDASLWNMSWSRDPKNPASLDAVLSDADSYGFSFVGFLSEVTGTIRMDELAIEGR